MDLGYLAAACLLASLSPGPASLSTLGTALRSGSARAQWHTLGLALAEIPVSFLALAVAAGLSQWPWLLTALAWAGVAWFGHTGVTLLLYPRDTMREEDVAIDGRLALFLRGLIVNLTNPKTIPWMLLVIQTARVPVDNLAPRDIALFLLCTVGAEALVMAGYAGLAGKLRPRLADPAVARGIDRATGVLWIILAGLALRAALG